MPIHFFGSFKDALYEYAKKDAEFTFYVDLAQQTQARRPGKPGFAGRMNSYSEFQSRDRRRRHLYIDLDPSEWRRM